MPDFIKKLLQNKIRNLQIDNRGDATANAIRKMLGQCPACEGKSTEHWYAPFAITIATEDTKDKLLHFLLP